MTNFTSIPTGKINSLPLYMVWTSAYFPKLTGWNDNPHRIESGGSLEGLLRSWGQKNHVLILILKISQSYWRIFGNRANVLVRVTPEISLSPSATWGHRSDHLQPASGPSLINKSTGTFFTDSSSTKWEMSFGCLKAAYSTVFCYNSKTELRNYWPNSSSN